LTPATPNVYAFPRIKNARTEDNVGLGDKLFGKHRHEYLSDTSNVPRPVQAARRPVHPAPKQMPTRRKKPAPPDQTDAENFYYVKQMQARTPVAVVLTDGEVLRGIVEWYDRECIKLTRVGSPNLLLYKHSIKYVYKEGDKAALEGTNGL
jgi:sRNA-binding regulator protein Hfq